METYYDYKHPIDDTIYWFFLPYKALDKMIANEFKNDKSDKINIYIDVYQLCISICRFTVIKNPYCISAAIINYCSHFRRYFKKIGVYANIVLIYTTNESDHIRRYIPVYDNHYRDRIEHNPKMKSIVDKNVDLLKIIVPYLPNIYLRVGTVESTLIAHDTIFRKLIGIAPSLLITQSQYAYQLPLLSKSLRVVRKYYGKKKDEDLSWCYNKDNCVEAYLFESRRANVLGGNFNQNTLSLLMTLNGIPKLSVKSMGFTYETILDMCSHVPAGYEHDPDIITDIYDKFTQSTYYLRRRRKNHAIPTAEEMMNRFKGIDIVYQYSIYKLLPEYNELDWLKQLDDKVSVHDINSTYYNGCELDLEGL